MISHDTVDVGEIGELAVLLKLKRLGHGANQLPKSDRGTDLLVSLRRNGNELAQFVGIQVKAGDSKTFGSAYRPRPERKLTGWWYSEYPDKHFDYWCFHSIPHFLVLHNERSGTSYWVHVTPDQVTKTPKGAKILVPTSNIIDESTTDTWIAIARAHSIALSFEGSIWRTSATPQLPATSRLRHALLAPRLVAPHPNQSFDWTFTPDQALALSLSGWRHYIPQWTEQNSSFPDLDSLASHPDWGWRLFHAVDRWLYFADLEPLESALSDAQTPDQIAATTVLLGCAFVSVERAEEAYACISQSLETKGLTDIDRAWLNSHLAQVAVELGRSAEGNGIAVSAIPILRTEIRDVTVTPILATLTDVIFHQTEYSMQDLEGVIRTRDNTPAWWRSIGVEGGLLREIDRGFLQESVSSQKEDRFDAEVFNRLYASATTALLCGEYQEWRRLTKTIAFIILADSDASKIVDRGAEVIRLLRLGAASTESARLVRRMSFSGPAEPLREAVRHAAQTSLSRHTWHSMAMLFKGAGQLLSEVDALHAMKRLLGLTDKTSPLHSEIYRSAIDQCDLIDALGVLAAAGGREGIGLLIDCLVTQSAPHEAAVNAWSNVVSRLPDETVELRSEDLSRLSHRKGWERIRGVMARKMALIEQWARVELDEMVRRFDPDVVSAIAGGTVPEELQREYVRYWGRQVDERIEECAAGHGLGMPTVEPAMMFLSAAIQTGDYDDWTALINFLKSDRVYSFLKLPVVTQLISVHGLMNLDVRAVTAQTLASGLPSRDMEIEQLDSGGRGLRQLALVGAYVLGGGPPQEIQRTFQELVLGDEQDQIAAVVLTRHCDVDCARGGLTAIVNSRSRIASVSARIELTLLRITDPESSDWKAAVDEVAFGTFGLWGLKEIVRRGLGREIEVVRRRHLLELAASHGLAVPERYNTT